MEPKPKPAAVRLRRKGRSGPRGPRGRVVVPLWPVGTGHVCYRTDAAPDVRPGAPRPARPVLYAAPTHRGETSDSPPLLSPLRSPGSFNTFLSYSSPLFKIFSDRGGGLCSCMDKGHLGGGGGGLLALDASPRPLGFLNLLSPPAPFHRSSMEADDGGGGGGRGRRSVEVDFFSDEKKNMKKTRVSASAADAEEQKSQADGLAIKKEDLTINLLPGNNNARSDRSMVVDDDAASRRHEEGRNNTELAAMQSELSRLNEENQRLRGMLTQVTNSYQALQMHLVALMQQRTQQLPPTQPQQPPTHQDGNKTEQGAMVPRQFLGLGPSGAGADVAEEPSNSSTEVGSPRRSSSNGNEDPERGDNPDGPSTAGWLPGRAMSQQLGAAAKGHDQQAQEATMRKARVSVRARSEAPIIADGCQWRKYGQKMAKGNPCPRAYYRCTMATGCPVRKQVQRCAEDRSILITTYEGTHNHPLPPAAMAMASTTSAAASMLLSGSMPSADGSGLMSSNFLARTVLPCSSSMATISASAPFPTVTLDLTHGPHGPPNALPLNAARPPAPGQFQIPLPGGGMAPAFAMPPHMLYNQSKFSGLQMSSAESVDAAAAAQFAQPRPPMGQISDTVSAAAAAITADPNFTVALAAAITSIIGGQHAAAAGNNVNNTNSNNNNNVTTTSNNTTSNNTNSETQ